MYPQDRHERFLIEHLGRSKVEVERPVTFVSCEERGDGVVARLEGADAKFHGVLTDVRNRRAWDDMFVDALCEPPETFSFGGMFAHVITFNAHRRMLAMDELRRLGVKVEGFGCPSEYLTSLASA